jgi:hypothetical protein
VLVRSYLDIQIDQGEVSLDLENTEIELSQAEVDVIRQGLQIKGSEDQSASKLSLKA